MINWLSDDWQNNRFRLIAETLGSLCFLSLMMYIAIKGNDTDAMVVFILQIAGSGLHGINSYMRNSANLFALNVVGGAIGLFGIINLSFWSN